MKTLALNLYFHCKVVRLGVLPRKENLKGSCSVLPSDPLDKGLTGDRKARLKFQCVFRTFSLHPVLPIDPFNHLGGSCNAAEEVSLSIYYSNDSDLVFRNHSMIFSIRRQLIKGCRYANDV